MLRLTPHSRFFSFFASPMRVCAVIFLGALGIAFLLASSAPGAVIAQQAPAADNQSTPPASDNAPAAQAPPAAALPAPSTSAPSPDSQPPAQAPSAQPPSAGQSPESTPTPPAASTGSQPAAPAQNQSAPPAASGKAPTPSSEPAEITEDEIKGLLVGKQLFLRGGYLDNDLNYNENGILVGHSPQGSYTLSAIQIDKVHLSKHKLELEGERYGLHFLGALPYEDPTKAVDRVNITPKKKVVKITIDRELVVKPKEKKEKEKEKGKPAPNAASAPAPPASTTPTPPAPSAEAPSAADNQEAQAEIAAAPPAERPADAKSVTTTTSQGHSNKLLRDALDNVFAQGFDARMMDAMPDFWKLYYAAAAAKTDYQPADPGVLRQSMVDKKARLVSIFDPASNQYAQDHGVAGMCLYHVVIGADGKPGEIAVARPIGFGLDESAVDTIRKASFEPAIKDSKPVPVLLDLVVEFRIYSNRTAVTANPAAQQPAAPSPSLPGPYSVQRPQ
jgi:outer membrane biosynthesis protein TonB